MGKSRKNKQRKSKKTKLVGEVDHLIAYLHRVLRVDFDVSRVQKQAYESRTLKLNSTLMIVATFLTPDDLLSLAEISPALKYISRVLLLRTTNTTPRNCLFVGCGNFSFEWEFARSCPHIDLFSSTFCPSEIDLWSQYPSSQFFSKDLSSIFFNIDATKVHNSFSGKQFDRIQFNFPHHDGRGNIAKNRLLLKNFFESAVQILHQKGEIVVVLIDGQGGTNHDQNLRETHNHWQIVRMAGYAGLICTDIHRFFGDCFPSYQCTGRRGGDATFFQANPLVHIFVRDSLGASSICPPVYIHDVSFYPPSGVDPFTYDFESFVFAHCPFPVAVQKLEKLENFVHPKTKEVSQTWRIFYRHPTEALTHEFVRKKIHGVLLWRMLELGLQHSSGNEDMVRELALS